MFGHWDGKPEWQGETVVVIGNAPSLTDDQLAEVRGRFKVIAANRAVQRAPWADMVVVLDAAQDQWDAVADFQGRKFGGVGEEIEGQDVTFPGMMYETIQLPDGGGAMEMRNNLLASLRMAQRMGVAKVILLGVDADKYAADNAAFGFSGYAQALEQVVADLESHGVQVTHSL